jgi:hypothetical protein
LINYLKIKIMERIDYDEVKRLRKIERFKDSHPMALRAEVRAAVPKPEQEKQYLFFYSVYSLIVNNEYKTISENEVKNALKQYPKMDIYVCQVENSPPKTPEVLKGQKIKRETIPSHEKLAEFIYQQTGVSVPEADLRPVQAKAVIPLVDKVRSLNKRVAEQAWRDKWTRETRERFMKCLQSGKSEAQCRIDCNIKK